MARSFSITSRVLLSTFDGAELAISVVTKSDRFATVITAANAIAPKGYSYAETIG